MKNRINLLVSLAFLSALPLSNAVASNSFRECLQSAILSANAETTVAELQQQCQQMTVSAEDKIDTAIEEQIAAETVIAGNKFSLLQHRANYVLPISYNHLAEDIEPSSIPGNARELDETEFKFQLSFKTKLWTNILASRASLYAAYTNTSWWQAYNKAESSPFRETNHQPELFLDVQTGFKLGDWELANIRFGAEHNSNGRSGEFSRTWNRLYTQFSFSNEFNQIHVKPWVSISDIEDNPNIEEFRGRAELAGEHMIGKHDLGWKLKHTLDNNNRGSVEADWSYPVNGREDVRFFVQYFDGYGESLIDYNLKARRLSLGFKLGG